MNDWLMPGIPRTIADEPSMETVRRIRASVTSDTGQVVESDIAALSKRPMEVMAEIDSLPDPKAEASPLDAAKRKRGGA